MFLRSWPTESLTSKDPCGQCGEENQAQDGTWLFQSHEAPILRSLPLQQWHTGWSENRLWRCVLKESNMKRLPTGILETVRSRYVKGIVLRHLFRAFDQMSPGPTFDLNGIVSRTRCLQGTGAVYLLLMVVAKWHRVLQCPHSEMTTKNFAFPIHGWNMISLKPFLSI